MLSVRRVAGAGVLALLAFSVALAGGGGNRTEAPSCTDSMRPIQVAGVNVKNFGVVDGHIYRGNQPSRDDYVALKSLGVSTIVDLRNDARPFARQCAEAAGMRYVNIPMDDKDKPYDSQMVEFLKTVTDPANGKCYVHCAGGRHRTGATIAVYRIAVQGWTADAAYAEMLNYDFYSRFGHGGYKSYVFDYFERMRTDPASVPVAYVAGVAPAIP